MSAVFPSKPVAVSPLQDIPAETPVTAAAKGTAIALATAPFATVATWLDVDVVACPFIGQTPTAAAATALASLTFLTARLLIPAFARV